MKKILLMLTIGLAMQARPWAQEVPRLNATAHWLANTGGTREDHIQNFITDMVVHYNPDPQFPRPMVLTASTWDEGGNAYGAYYLGKSVGKSEWWRNVIYSDTAAYGTNKCWIVNYWARASYYKGAYVGHTGTPPTGANAPYVKCNDGSVIKSVVDPSALAFDLSGNLLVGDNGPDQNIKIFSPVKKLLRVL